MKALSWIVAGVGIGFAIYAVLNSPQYATGSADVDDAAFRTSFWGTKQRFGGAGRNLAGRMKEGLGRAIGDDQMAGEGVVDQVAGAVKNTAGGVAQAVGGTMRDLNR